MLWPSSWRGTKNMESRERATCECECRTRCASEYTSAVLRSPTCVRTSWPMKVRGSMGSEERGVNDAHAASFQNSTLRRGSSPAVENVSRCATRLHSQCDDIGRQKSRLLPAGNRV